MRRRAFTATTRTLLAAAGVMAMVVVLPAAEAGASGPSLKASPSKGLNPGDVVSLKGAGLTGLGGEFVAQCAPGATLASSCDAASEVAITVDSKGHLLSPLTFSIPGPADGLCTAPGVGVALVTCGIGLVSGSSATVLTKVTFPDYYLSIGDSYSVGYQPVPSPVATYGYTGYVAKKEKLTLENFGCGGATTASLTTFTGVCGTPGSYGPPAAFNPGPIPAGDSQVTAVDAFIAAHHGQIGLITVSIGGNDVTPCVSASATNPVNGATTAVQCVINGLGTVSANISGIVSNLSAATGGTVDIVGLTYPDVLLGLYECTITAPSTTCAADPTNSLIGASVTVFQNYLNVYLKNAYTSVAHGFFVDVTAATGAYGSMTKLKNTPPYGKIPVPVANVCNLTYYCSLGNIHENSKGYQDEGKDITSTPGL